MVVTRLRPALALVAIVGSSAVCAPGAAAKGSLDLRRQPAIQGDASAGAGKATVCGGCHGPQGNAPIAEFPSIAGQSATYLYLQLRAYQDGTRPNDVMRPLVERLSDQDLKDLSAYYASLPAARSTAAVEGSSDAGRQLFARGNAPAGIPPCQGCHGVEGKGIVAPPARSTTNWHTFPRLAGQQPQYVIAELNAYRSRTRADSRSDRIMQGVAQNLDDSAIRDIAAYLGQLAQE